MLGNVVKDNSSGRVKYTWTTTNLSTLSTYVLSHIDELTADSYLIFVDDYGSFIKFGIGQYINTSTDKRVTFTCPLWTGLYTMVCSSTSADVGMIIMNASLNTSTWMFTGSIDAGQGKITSWQGSKTLVI